MFAIWQARLALEQTKESGREYTIDISHHRGYGRRTGRGSASASPPSRMRHDLRPQATGLLCIRWVPAHAGAVGNEVADRHAKGAATGRAPSEELSEGYAGETPLSHMTRVATEARSKATTDWITYDRDDATDILLGRASGAPS